VKGRKYTILGAKRVGEKDSKIIYCYYLFHDNVFVWEFVICVLYMRVREMRFLHQLFRRGISNKLKEEKRVMT
jgi:hypothetical protein